MNATRSLTTAVITAGVALACAGGADANTYCVDAPTCGGTAAPGLQEALAAAHDNSGPDRVEIGPGSYFPGPGSFTYKGAAKNKVTIAGAGADKTHIIATAPSLNVLVLDHADVSDLEVQGVPPAGKPGHPAALDLQHGTASRLRLTDGVVGAQLGDGATLTSSHVSGSGDGTDAAVVAFGANTRLVDSSVDAPHGGILAVSSTLDVVRSRIKAPIGVQVEDGSQVRVSDSLVEAPSKGYTVGISAFCSIDCGAEVAGTTIYEPGVDGTGVAAQGLDSGELDVTVENTAIAAGHESLSRKGSIGAANLTVGSSAFDPKSITQYGPGSLHLVAGNVSAPPAFVAPALRDFHLRPGSPLIDKGIPGPAGGLSPTDLAGSVRSLDGNGDGKSLPDIGAFESPAVAPKIPKPPIDKPGDPKPPIGQPDLAPVLSRVSLTHRRFSVHKRATAFRFKLSENARVTIKIGRRKLVRKAHPGANRVTFAGRIGRYALKRGRYVARVTARDAGGHASKTRTVSFRVL
jgi:hypothetical protein